MQSSQDISNQIRAQLKLLDPDFSAEPLTPERKIIDTVSEVIAGGQSDQNTLQYQFDIDSKVGSDLDNFVALFGFARQTGIAATGLITFSTSSAALLDIYIPVGTQVSTSSSSITTASTFVTTSSTTIFAGTTSAIATIQCTTVGTNGNVPANTITTFLGTGFQSSQISSCNNTIATSNGSNIESDQELRLRFKNTVFRNIAGTSDQFLSIALTSQFTSRARVIGAEDIFIENAQFNNNLIVSTIPFSKYTFNFNYYLIQNSTGTDVFFNPSTDYSFGTTYTGTVVGATTGTVRPFVTLLNSQPSNDFTNGSVVIFQHTYNSINSRNNPASGILNYIDVYVDGINPIAVSESTVLPATTQLLNSNSSSPYYVNNFRIKNTRASVSTGLLYQKLIWQPITLLPSQIMIGNSTYTQNVDFYLAEDITTNRGSKLANDGILWNPAAFNQIYSLPTVSGTFSIQYEFNNIPATLNQTMNKYKQVTTDVLVHSSNQRYFVVNLSIVYTSGFFPQNVDANINTALNTYFSSFDFGGTVIFSDIEQVAHNVLGVDNIRISTRSDSNQFGGGYGVTEVAPDGITIVSGPYVTDFSLNDIDIPILQQLNITQLAQNTFTSGSST